MDDVDELPLSTREGKPSKPVVAVYLRQPRGEHRRLTFYDKGGELPEFEPAPVRSWIATPDERERFGIAFRPLRPPGYDHRPGWLTPADHGARDKTSRDDRAPADHDFANRQRWVAHPPEAIASRVNHTAGPTPEVHGVKGTPAITRTDNRGWVPAELLARVATYRSVSGWTLDEDSYAALVNPPGSNSGCNLHRQAQAPGERAGGLHGSLAVRKVYAGLTGAAVQDRPRGEPREAPEVFQPRVSSARIVPRGSSPYAPTR